MNQPALHSDQRFTWADYQTWPKGERWELIDGEALAMSPSPTSRHQDAITKLAVSLFPYFKGKNCRVFVAPMDVKLSDEDVVQPDLLVVCKPEQIKRTHIDGPPTLVVEILSETSINRDRNIKRELYARAGIAEYWIVTPFPHLVEIFVLGPDGLYVWWKTFTNTDELVSHAFPDLRFPLEPLFDFPLEEHEKEIYRVKKSPGPYPAQKTG